MRNTIATIFWGFLGAGLFQLAYSHLYPAANASSNLEKVVRASRIDLEDSSGKLRAQLGFSKEGPPGLWFMDQNGVARIAMGLYPDGTSHFGLQDKQGRMIQLMRSVGETEQPLLIFKNGGQDKMILGLNSQLESFFVSFDNKKGKKSYPGFADGP